MTAPDMSVTLAGLHLKSPVMTASGTCGYGLELLPYLDPARLGALVVKGLSLEPRAGNPPPRIVETPCGMLNSIGLENVGLQAFVQEFLPRLRELPTPLIVNLLGESRRDYAGLVEYLDEQDGVAALEINVSCPNVEAGGIAFGKDPAAVEDLVRFLRPRTAKPMFIKLSPEAPDIAEVGRHAEGAGADGLTLINTLRGLAVDAETRRARLASVTGGLSGPAIKPVALRMVWEASRSVGIPVIGVGGILDAADALEFLIAGAAAVQVGTATLRNPTACTEIIDGIEDYLQRHGLVSVRELIGSLAPAGRETPRGGARG